MTDKSHLCRFQAPDHRGKALRDLQLDIEIAIRRAEDARRAVVGR